MCDVVKLILSITYMVESTTTWLHNILATRSYVNCMQSSLVCSWQEHCDRNVMYNQVTIGCTTSAQLSWTLCMTWPLLWLISLGQGTSPLDPAWELNGVHSTIVLLLLLLPHADIRIGVSRKWMKSAQSVYTITYGLCYSLCICVHAYYTCS